MTDEEASITFRRVMSGAWVWELKSADGHVCSRSEEFESRAEAELDAVRRGQIDAS